MAEVHALPRELSFWCLLWSSRDDDVFTTLEVILTADASRDLFDFLAGREKRIDVTLNCFASFIDRSGRWRFTISSQNQCPFPTPNDRN